MYSLKDAFSSQWLSSFLERLFTKESAMTAFYNSLIAGEDETLIFDIKFLEGDIIGILDNCFLCCFSHDRSSSLLGYKGCMRRPCTSKSWPERATTKGARRAGSRPSCRIPCRQMQEMIERQEAHRKDEAAKDPYQACCRIEPFLHPRRRTRRRSHQRSSPTLSERPFFSGAG